MIPRKVDENQKAVVAEFREWFPQATVFVASGTGNGFPDLVIGFEGRTYLFELKDPKKPASGRSLTDLQVTFHRQWNGHVAVAHTATEIAAKIAIELAKG